MQLEAYVSARFINVSSAKITPLRSGRMTQADGMRGVPIGQEHALVVLGCHKGILALRRLRNCHEWAST
jgi:hypothetical protein